MKHRLFAVAVAAALAVSPLTFIVTASAAAGPSPRVVTADPASAMQARIEAALAGTAGRVLAAKEHRAGQVPAESIASPRGGATAAAPAQAQTVGGTAELAAAAATSRIAGDSRYETAIRISQDVHPDPALDFGGIVFIANGLNFPDALAAGPAATSSMGPILLVPPTGGLPANVRAEIERLDPVSIAILGKTDNVSQQTEDDLLGMFPAPGPEEEPAVFRVAGDSRYETSALLSLFVYSFVDLGNGEFDYLDPDTAYISNGLTFADALAGGAAGGYEGAPLFLTAPGSLSEAVESFLEPIPAEPEFGYPGQEYTTVRILGSSASVSEAVVTRIRQILPNVTITRYPGANRFQTAAMLNADVFTGPVEGVTMTNGLRFPDALAGATRVNVTGGPTVLTQTACAPAATIGTLQALTPAVTTALGKTDAVSEAALNGTAC